MSVGRIVGGLAALLSTTLLAAEPRQLPTNSAKPQLFHHKLPLPLPLEQRIHELEFHPLEYSGNTPLQPEIEAMLNSLATDEQLAFLAYDVANKRMLVTISENRPMLAASMLKPFVVLAYFHTLDTGKAPQPYDADMHQLMVRMIKDSKNDETNVLMGMLGGPEKVQLILTTHYSHIFRHTSIVQYIPLSGKEYLNRASVSDFARFVHALIEGELPHGDRILGLLGLEKKSPVRVAAGLKSSFRRIYNKTGTTAHACGDFAYVKTQHASGEMRYIIAGVIEKQQPAPNAWIPYCAEKLRDISKEVPRYLIRQRF